MLPNELNLVSRKTLAGSGEKGWRRWRRWRRILQANSPHSTWSIPHLLPPTTKLLQWRTAYLPSTLTD